MALTMTRPYRDPKTGIYKVRKVVPESLRARIGQRELKQSLHTKDPTVARAAAPAVVVRMEARIAAARDGGSKLSERDVQALCGIWYRGEETAWADEPGRELDAEFALDDLIDQVVPSSSSDDPSDIQLTARDRVDARKLLIDHGHHADPALIDRLATAMFPARVRLAGLRLRRTKGDWSPDPNAERFPEPATRASAPSAPAMTPSSLRGLLADWRLVVTAKASTLRETDYAIEGLIAHLGHDDADRLQRPDLIRWRDAQKKAGRTNNTWNNRLSLIKQVLDRGSADGKIAPGGLPTPTRTPCASLRLARREKRPSRRWAHWVMAFTGMRVAEVLQLSGGDVRQDGDIWFISVNEDGEGKSVKTSQTRHVPVHEALIREGLHRLCADDWPWCSALPGQTR